MRETVSQPRRRGLRHVKLVLIIIASGLFVWTCLWELGLVPPRFAHEVQAYFEWDARRGFTTLRFSAQGWGEDWHEVGGRVWRYFVSLQLKPPLDSYLRQPGWQRINGTVPVAVAKFIPLARPIALGGGGDVLYDPDETALMHAAARGDSDSVEQLLGAGADANARDQRGQTALIHACLHGRGDLTLIRALLAAGADANAKDRWGRTPLLFCVQTEQSVPGMRNRDGAAVVRELLAAHANVNAGDEKGVTPLIMAARDADIGTVRALLAAGADVNARNNQGQTALALAEARGDPEIIQLLKESRARP